MDVARTPRSSWGQGGPSFCQYFGRSPHPGDVPDLRPALRRWGKRDVSALPGAPRAPGGAGPLRPAWHVPCPFEDGEALFEVVYERGLEGVVAKRLSSLYRPGQRQWIKAKNPSYWRLEEERQSWDTRVGRQPVTA